MIIGEEPPATAPYSLCFRHGGMADFAAQADMGAKVKKGKVKVRDFKRRKKVLVKAGKKSLARR